MIFFLPDRTLPAGARFALGMLTVIPVRVRRVDRGAAGAGMLWAPAVGVVVGVLQYAVFLAVALATGDDLTASVAAIAAGALLTRGLHLDGLADVADGLGSGRPPEQAMEVMKRSDVGPFGVAALLLTLLLQISALAAAARNGAAGPAIVAAAAAGRLALPWACRRGVPAARPGGLGAMVAGSVRTAGAGAVTLAVLAAGAPAGAAVLGPAGAAGVPASMAAGLLAAWAFRRHLVRRLGGVTGDVLGSLVETSVTATLLATAITGHLAAAATAATAAA